MAPLSRRPGRGPPPDKPPPKPKKTRAFLAFAALTLPDTESAILPPEPEPEGDALIVSALRAREP